MADIFYAQLIVFIICMLNYKGIALPFSRVSVFAIGCKHLKEIVTLTDVEVVELRLDQEERLRLNEYSFYFEDDAWLAVGANIQHSTEAQGLIVPVFTESEDEKFWLFYTIQNPSKLVKASFTYKIKGYWLDLQGQSNYKLLNNHQDYVTIANLIKNGPCGPLYFLQGVEISDD